MASPDVSVVMSVYNAAGTVMESIHSVLSQEGVSLELIVINDGSNDGTAAILDEAARRDARLKVVHKPNEGLTRALIEGCAAARGVYIARIDAGDVMLPDRLVRQKAVLDAHPEAVLVTCWTEFCGPEWEPLYVENGNPTPPGGMNVLPAVHGSNLLLGPSHHGSVMFRRAVYEDVGGYRWQFYYGQDWDLWYRFAERGKFVTVSEVLSRVRVFARGLSAMHRRTQAAIGRCSLGAFWSRRRGLSDAQWLDEAARIRPGGRGCIKDWGRAGEGAHFIGELLRRNGDVRCRRYFVEALRMNALRANTWFRLLQSYASYVKCA